MEQIAIIDSGGANLASLQFALERLGARSRVTSDANEIRAAAHVILPGVGSAGDAMRRLRERRLDRLIPELAQPVLGICLGMQLLFDRSEEGATPCLGVMPGTVARLRPPGDLPVPHMGWNRLHPLHEDPLLEGVGPDDYVYFVHGFAVPVTAETLASTDYGGELSAVVRRANFRGTQFHPERSGPVGARVLANFLRGDTCC
jgi:glutamine amidotransferase